ncbi:MAG: type I secretion system permease/ATPase [Euryarchaeota archaeon]|nr:type I secretion system permease/ATPase [Euryarchaeota archaeon]|tara:strand:+ start:10030 stop:11733 length:1704 start_codon:yes stop_codon:yes gene_type:complete
MNEEKKIKTFSKDHWFWGAIFDNKSIYVQVFVASVFINIFGFVSAFYIMTVYDRVLPNNAMNSLIALTIGIAFVILFDFILKIIRSYFSDVASKDLDKKISKKLIDKLLSHDEKIIQSPAEITSSIREFDSVRDFFTSASLLALVDLPFMFLFLGVIYSIAGPLALVPILIVPLVLIVSALVQPFLKRFSEKDLSLKQGKARVLSELTQNLESVRSVAGGNFLKKRWMNSVEEQNNATISSKIASNLAITFGQTALQISQTGIIVYGVILIAALEISQGALIACVILSGRTLSPLIQASQLLTRVNLALSAYQKVDKMMSTDSRDEELEHSLGVKLDDGNIELNNLSFEAGETKILDNISFKIESGETLGLVGSLGSGKSSLIRNIIGFHLPQLGMVKIGNYDVNNIPSETLRNEIGYCPQNIQLFSGTIYENISSSKENSTEEDVIEAAKITNAHNFIARLPGGYNYVLRENGTNLSGGQRQAISLARALIKKPKILVLDEPTSSMDGETEQLVINNIYNIDYKPTIIIASHKISILTTVDKIAIIGDGKLLNFGPASEIIKVNNT